MTRHNITTYEADGFRSWRLLYRCAWLVFDEHTVAIAWIGLDGTPRNTARWPWPWSS